MHDWLRPIRSGPICDLAQRVITTLGIEPFLEGRRTHGRHLAAEEEQQ